MPLLLNPASPVEFGISGDCPSCQNYFDVQVLFDGKVATFKEKDVSCPHCGNSFTVEFSSPAVAEIVSRAAKYQFAGCV